ncbi:MAG: NFACT family protein [Clostridia bacterium]|nr:NFACT family protein [Clostridia bacterium]
MAFDAGMLRCSVNEINNLKESRIEKIYQPSNDEIVILLHSAKEKARILINAGANYPRINITKIVSENPQKAPMLCMLLRKHLGGGKLLNARVYGFERVCSLEFEAYDEMGFKSSKFLICEIMGKYSNIILTDNNKKILALLKTVDFTTSKERQLLVGMKYELPPKQDKLDTDTLTESQFLLAYDRTPYSMSIAKFITSNFTGIAISTARQIAYKCCKDADGILENVEKQTLCQAFFEIINSIKLNIARPYLVLNENGEPVEFSYTPLNFFGKMYESVLLESFGELIDKYFSKKSNNERIKQKSSDIFRLLVNAENRINKKIALQSEELFECESMDKYRIMADLITANLYMIKSGVPYVEVINYYDDEMKTIRIPLDIKFSPSQNAQRYYKKYSKLKKAKIELAKQIELSKRELDYIASVLDSLTRAELESDLNQIRDELYHSGYASKMKNYNIQKGQVPKPLKFITSGGYTVLCGKNNVQNDYITTKLAEKTDWWFHVKNMAGSHVLMQCTKEEPSEIDFTEAAEIAAFYSKAEGNNIAVDYTNAKHVKKPAGSKPGYVIYHVNWTAYVSPNEEKIKKMQVKQ